MDRIMAVETFIVGVPPPYKGGLNWLFVKLTTSDGVVGWGECTACTFREKSLVAIIDEVCEHFILGRQNPFNIEQMWADLYSGDQTQAVKSFTNYRPSGSLGMQAIAALEMACWDIVGKSVGQPVYRFLGGRFREKVRSYTYIYEGWKLGDPPAKAGEAALLYAEKGFTAIKLDPVPPYFPQARDIGLEELKYAEAVLGEIRDSVGSRCDIIVGTHGQLATHSAIKLASVIEPFSPLWFEEPVPPENVEEMARVSRSTKTPIATGERLCTKWQFEPVLRNQAAQIIQPNVGLNGILETKKIAALAEVHYAQIAPWIYCGPVAGAAAIHIDVSTPNFLIQEGIDDWGGFSAEVMKHPIRWEHGFLIPPELPGLGADLDEAVLRRYPMHDYAEMRRAGTIDRHGHRMTRS